MHKFVQRSHDEYFCNERTLSIPLDPNSCFGSFRTVSLQHELWCQTDWTGAINAQDRAKKSRMNFSQRRHPIHPIGPQIDILGRIGPFRYCTNFGAKRAEQVQLMYKFVPESHVGIFCNERTRSTPWDPKLGFLGRLGTFITAQTLVQNRLN
jgi:hypothetical protein